MGKLTEQQAQQRETRAHGIWRRQTLRAARALVEVRARQGVDEWFYAIDVSLPDGTVRLGLQDSTAMFVEGGESGVREVAEHFTDLIWDS